MKKRASKKKRDVEILRNAMTPFAHEDGTPRGVSPYLPVLRACDLCPARCCRCQVKCSLPDAVHFCTTIGVPFFVPLELIAAAEPGPRTFRVDIDPRALAPGTEWKGHVEIVLRRKDGACASLLRIGGYERCGAYAARPMTCRIYPLSWSEGPGKQFGPRTVLCAVPYAITPGAETQLKEDIERYHSFWKTHEEIAALWNERAEKEPHHIEDFLSFTLPLAAEKMGVSVGSMLEKQGPDARLYHAMQNARR